MYNLDEDKCDEEKQGKWKRELLQVGTMGLSDKGTFYQSLDGVKGTFYQSLDGVRENHVDFQGKNIPDMKNKV